MKKLITKYILCSISYIMETLHKKLKKGVYISNVLGCITFALVQKRELTPSLHW